MAAVAVLRAYWLVMILYIGGSWFPLYALYSTTSKKEYLLVYGYLLFLALFFFPASTSTATAVLLFFRCPDHGVSDDRSDLRAMVNRSVSFVIVIGAVVECVMIVRWLRWPDSTRSMTPNC